MRAFVVLAALSAGCFDPGLGEVACGDGFCPTGLVCFDGLCRESRGDTACDAEPCLADASLATQWTLVQTDGAEGEMTQIAASGAGNLLVVAVETDRNPVTSVSDNAGNVYVAVSGSRGVDGNSNLGVEIWYTPSSNPGATMVTATGTKVWGLAVWEVSGIRATNPVDVVSQLDDQPTSSEPVGAAITTSTAGAFVVSVTIVENVVQGLTSDSDFTRDLSVFGNGWGHLTSASAPPETYQAQWRQSNAGSSCASSVAFAVGPDSARN